MELAARPISLKRCSRCHEILDLTCFSFKHRDRGIRQSWCRACASGLARMYYQRDSAPYKARAAANNRLTKKHNRARLHEYLQTAECMDCGLRDFAVLELDHRDPQDKRDDVSNLVRQPHGWPTIAKEIAKCDVVCANCHRKRTARRFGWRRLLGLEELVLPPLPRRGTPDYERIKWTRSGLARRHRNRTHLFGYLRQHPCAVCSEADPVVLEFDHLRDKLRDVTVIARFGGWNDLLVEIEKCRVLCANCHRRHTAVAAGRER